MENSPCIVHLQRTPIVLYCVSENNKTKLMRFEKYSRSLKSPGLCHIGHIILLRGCLGPISMTVMQSTNFPIWSFPNKFLFIRNRVCFNYFSMHENKFFIISAFVHIFKLKLNEIQFSLRDLTRLSYSVLNNTSRWNSIHTNITLVFV